MVKYTWKRYFKELLPFAKPYRKTIGLVILFTLFSVGLDLCEPIIYKHVLNDLSGVYVHKTFQDNVDITDENLTALTQQKHAKHEVAPRTIDQAFKTLVIAAVALFLLNILSYFFSLVGDYYSAKYANGIEQDFIERAFEHVLRLKLSFFSKNTSASLAKKIDQTDQVGAAVQTLVEGVSSEVFKLVGASGIMFYHNPRLAALSLVSIPFYILISRKMATKLEGTSEEYLETWDEVNTKLQDNLNHVKTVKTSGAEERVVKRFKGSLETALGQYLSRSKMENFYIFFQNVCIHSGKLLVLIYGSYQVLEHKLTPGDVVMFVSLLDQMYSPIDELTSHAINIQLEKVSISRGLALFHSGKEEKKGKALEIHSPTVAFRDVTFAYVKGHNVLHNISFELKPNSYNVLVGTSGSGKSTILDLLLNFYSNSEGSILVDGTDIAHVQPSSLRGQIGLVAADGAIFRGTVKENILFRNPEATDEEIGRAIKMSGLTSTIDRLPDGLETEVGDMGIGMSVGERQRLQLARMLVSKPRIILLDEATANLDYATESEIKKILLSLKKHTTIVVVAHRYSMVEGADHAIVLDAGKIKAQGTIAEVLEKSDWFRGMANAHKEGQG